MKYIINIQDFQASLKISLGQVLANSLFSFWLFTLFLKRPQNTQYFVAFLKIKEKAKN